jgi:hypothetical protein
LHLVWSGRASARGGIGGCHAGQLGRKAGACNCLVVAGLGGGLLDGNATEEVKGTEGAAIKTALAGLLAVLAFAMPIGGWFWRIQLGLAPGVLGDLLLARGGVRRFLAGVAR